MIGLVMAGGKGSRMISDQEKLLLTYKKPIILHVLEALQASNCFSKIIVATSPNSPKTRDLMLKNKIEIIETKGNGYVEDLNFVLNSLSDFVFICSADLPFLDEEIIKNMISNYNKEHTWTSFVTTKEFLKSQKLNAEFPAKFNNTLCYYSGISIVNSKNILKLDNIQENFQVCNDRRIAFNLNTKQDYDLLSTT